MTALGSQAVSVASPAAVAHEARAVSNVAAPVTGPASGAHRVLLPDGRQVTLLASGSVASEPGGLLELVQAGGSTQVVATRLGPLGRLVDRSAYNVNALATLEAKSGGTLPLTISYTGTRPTLAGFTWTGRNAGYLTASSAASFGKALGAGAAGHVTHIALLGATTVSPTYVMHTLTIKLNVTGTQTDQAEVFVNNVDDLHRWQISVFLAPGEQAKISVPNGHYAITTFFSAGDTALLAFQPLTMSHDTTFTSDARLATVAQSTVSTPRPAQEVFYDYQVNILDASGRAIELIIVLPDAAHQKLLVSPVLKSSPLKVRTQTMFHLESDQTAPNPYSYDVAFQGDSVPATQQHYVAQPSSLAAVHASFYDDGVSTDLETSMQPALLSPNPDDTPEGGVLYEPVTAGTSRTQYTTAGIYWQPAMEGQDSAGNNGFDNYGPYRKYTPGSTPELGFLRGPLHPGFEAPTSPVWSLTSPYDQPACVVCRNGDDMEFGFSQFADQDNNRDLDGDPNIVVQLLRNGTPIVTTNDPLSQGQGIQVPTAAATYALHYDLARPTAGTSTQTRTVWTFHSGRTTGALMHDNVQCQDPFVNANVTTCHIEDLLNDQITVPQDLHDTEPVGPTTAQITIIHAPGAATPPITSFSTQVSFDEGTTWQPTTITATDGNTYQVAYSNAEGATSATLRVQAADKGGATFDQTITRAYLVH